MDTGRSQKVQRLFAAAYELEPSLRSDFLNQACGDDPQLRWEVERLLAAERTTLLQDPAQLPEPLPGQVLQPKQVLSGRFRIIRLVGRGGMGEVYEAADAELGGTVAVKTLRPELSSNEAFVARFRREVQLARRVTHSNICRVFDVGYDNSDGHSRAFLTMEFLDGETLTHYMHREKRAEPRQVARLVEQIASGLAALHENGIIHRDLKPGNIMLVSAYSGRMRAVVNDFGLSRTVLDNASSVVGTAGFAGTPDYMSPEQLLGKRLTPASDVYALGLVMFEMITGRRPFGGGHAVQNAVQRVTENVESPAKLVPGLDPGWESLILRCLAREPGQRPQMQEIVAALQVDPASGSPASARLPDPVVAPLPPPPTAALWRKSRVKAGIAAGVVVLIAIGSWLIFRKMPAPQADVVTRRLTADAGLSFDPAISRDGKLVAFASDRAGAGDLDIYVQQIGGSAPIRLTTTNSDETSPDFSPDGTRIVFRSERDGGGIYAVSTFGGEAVLLAGGGRDPKFSPDGRWIAFWTGREGTGYMPGSARVLVIPAGGGDAKPIAPDFAVSHHPVWSPSGESLLALARKDASGSIDATVDWFAFAMDGKPPRKTGALPLFRSMKLDVPSTQIQTDWIPLAWLDQPSRVVFAAASGDSTNLLEAKINASLAIQEKPVRLTSGTAYESQASFSAGNTRFVYSSLRLNFDIWGIPLDADRGAVTGPIRRLTREESIEAYPSLSWDGTMLSFRSRVAASMALRVIDLTSGKGRVLLSTESTLNYPRISGDGATVTYRDASRAIQQLSTQGGAAKTLCQDCGFPIDAARDSRHILVEPTKPPDSVLMLDAETGKISTLAPARQVLLGARWSADGKWIAFHELRKGTDQSAIYIAAAGAEPTPPEQWIEVTDGSGKDRDPAWAPSGNLLYFLSSRDGFRCLYAQRLDRLTKKPQGSAIAIQHLHEPGRSLKFLGNLDAAIGLSVAKGIAVLTLGELTGNIWQRD